MDTRIIHYGLTANLGGVEKYVNNLSKKTNYTFDFIVTFQEKMPFEDEYINRGSNIFRIVPRRDNYFKHYFQLYRVLKNNKKSIVHIHVNSLSSLAVAKVSKLLGIKTIIHSHTTKLWGGKINLVLHKLNSLLLPVLSCNLLACSVNAGKFMFKNLPFKVACNGIDIDECAFDTAQRDKIRKELNLENRFVLGHIGMFSYIKNQLFLVDVLNEIVKSNNDVILVFVGEGSELSKVKDKVNQLNLANNVVFAGRRNDVSKILSSFDMFLLPSLFEGFPITLVEAQANGLPIIASKNIDMSTKINTNFLFCDLDVSAWANEIMNASHNKRLLNQQCVEKSDYNINNSVKVVEEMYETLNINR